MIGVNQIYMEQHVNGVELWAVWLSIQCRAKTCSWLRDCVVNMGVTNNKTKKQKKSVCTVIAETVKKGEGVLSFHADFQCNDTPIVYCLWLMVLLCPIFAHRTIFSVFVHWFPLLICTFSLY